MGKKKIETLRALKLDEMSSIIEQFNGGYDAQKRNEAIEKGNADHSSYCTLPGKYVFA